MCGLNVDIIPLGLPHPPPMKFNREPHERRHQLTILESAGQHNAPAPARPACREEWCRSFSATPTGLVSFQHSINNKIIILQLIFPIGLESTPPPTQYSPARSSTTPPWPLGIATTPLMCFLSTLNASDLIRVQPMAQRRTRLVQKDLCKNGFGCTAARRTARRRCDGGGVTTGAATARCGGARAATAGLYAVFSLRVLQVCPQACMPWGSASFLYTLYYVL